MEMLTHIAEWGVPTAIIVLIIYIYQLQLWRREERKRQKEELKKAEDEAKEAIQSGNIDRIVAANRRVQDRRGDRP